MLACKNYNTGYKLDLCFLIDGNGQLTKLPRKERPEPGTHHAFINPRIENPNDFLLLDLQTYTFHNIAQVRTFDWLKAEQTLEILQLNKRDALIQGRKAVARSCFDYMSRLCAIKAANSRQEVERCLYPGANMLDWSQPLDLIQADLTQSFKNLLLSLSHPAVWHAIKIVASQTEHQWQEIFHQIPEALTW